MSAIGTIPNVKFINPSDRVHTYVLDFVVATASIGAYLNAYNNLPVTSYAPANASGTPQYPSMLFQSLACGKHVAFVPDDVLREVFAHDQRKEAIAYLEENSYANQTGPSSGAVAEILEGLAQAMFTRYWETNLPAIEAAHGKRGGGNWPMVLQFAAVVRDAMSHGGTIHMRNHVPAATWYGLTYAPSDNGKRIFHQDLTTADIFYLLLDVDGAY